MSQAVYDLIGDIHGQAGKLEALLRKLGYTERAGSWVPPAGRQAVFVGDLIDRGPEQIKVVQTVRAMVDAGDARCIMGNHEFNAIGHATRRGGGGGAYFRERTPNKLAQHAEFLRQVGDGSALHRELVTWFRTLPPALDLGPIRAVHAWWHPPYAQLVMSRLAGRPMDDEFLEAAYTRGSDEWRAMEELTKGLEIRLPAGASFTDHSGIERFDARTRWWLDEPTNLREVVIAEGGEMHSVPEHPLPADYLGAPAQGTPVFIGHYWMQGTPVPMSPKVACLDWSAAKAGPLVAYRWDGETEIDAHKFVAAK